MQRKCDTRQAHQVDANNKFPSCSGTLRLLGGFPARGEPPRSLNSWVPCCTLSWRYFKCTSKLNCWYSVGNDRVPVLGMNRKGMPLEDTTEDGFVRVHPAFHSLPVEPESWLADIDLKIPLEASEAGPMKWVPAGEKKTTYQANPVKKKKWWRPWGPRCVLELCFYNRCFFNLNVSHGCWVSVDTELAKLRKLL